MLFLSFGVQQPDSKDLNDQKCVHFFALSRLSSISEKTVNSYIQIWITTSDFFYFDMNKKKGKTRLLIDLIESIVI